MKILIIYLNLYLHDLMMAVWFEDLWLLHRCSNY